MIHSHGNPRWPNDPSDDRVDLEKRAERYRKALGVDDLDALAEQLLTLQRALRKDTQPPRLRYDLGGPPPKCGLEISSFDQTAPLAIRWSQASQGGDSIVGSHRALCRHHGTETIQCR